MNITRYIIRGLIDGSLSVMGVVIGAFNPDVNLIISAGIAGGLANGVSNILAAFSAEHAIRYKYLKDLEESLLTSLKDTEKEQEVEKEVRNSAFFDGLSTIIGGAIPLAPFFFLEGNVALFSSIGVTLCLFIGLGVYTGYVSKKSIFMSCIKMVLFGIITALVCFSVRYIIK